MTLRQDFDAMLDDINEFYKIVPKSGGERDLDDTLYLESIVKKFKDKLPNPDDELLRSLNKFISLLKANEEGLFTWNMMMAERIEEIRRLLSKDKK